MCFLWAGIAILLLFLAQMFRLLFYSKVTELIRPKKVGKVRFSIFFY